MTHLFDFCPNCGSNKIPCGCVAAMRCRWCSRHHHPKVACEAKIKGIEKIARDAMSKAKEQEKTMTAPTEAQLNDPAWWDENAPEWAKSIIRAHNSGGWCWFEHVRGRGVAENIATGEKTHADTGGWHCWEVVHRPTKPAAPEWDGEGLPPVGCECEFCYAGEGWIGRTCEVIAIDHDRDLLWLHLDGNEKSNLYRSDLFQFRPLRTAEQRQQLVAAIARAPVDPHGYAVMVHPEMLADALIADGWRKGDE